MFKRIKLWFLIVLVVAAADLACAKEGAIEPAPLDSDTKPIPLEQTKVPSPKPVRLETIDPAVEKFIGRKDTVDTLVGPLFDNLFKASTNSPIISLINDFNITPLISSANSQSDGGVMLGFSYDFNKSLVNRSFFENSSAPLGVSAEVSASGKIAFDASKNPENLLQNSGSLHLLQGFGGFEPSATSSDAQGVENLKNLLNQTQAKDSEFHLQRGETYEKYARDVQDNLIPQLIYDIQFHGTFESNQQFTTNQWAYGIIASVAYRDWNTKSKLGWWNILDYPFALTRMLLNKESFQPSGRSIPSIVIGIDEVDPTGNGEQDAVGAGTGSYERFRFETAFKTRWVRWESKPLYFTATYRFFQEIDAPASVREAGYNRTSFIGLKLDLPKNFNITFGNGTLPLNLKSQQIYALGYSINF